MSNKKSSEMVMFEKVVRLIFDEFLNEFNFKHLKSDIDEFSASIFYQFENRYIKIDASIHPRDLARFYNVILGEGKIDWPESDWNSTALWRIKMFIDPKIKAKEYSLDKIDGIEFSIENAKSELSKYGSSFLKGDMSIFRTVRSSQNKDREPYKFHEMIDGDYHTKNDMISEELKKRYT